MLIVRKLASVGKNEAGDDIAIGEHDMTDDRIRAKRIGHATFETPDLERQIAYYQNVVTTLSSLPGAVCASIGARSASSKR